MWSERRKRNRLLEALAGDDDRARWGAARALSGPVGAGLAEELQRLLVEAEDPRGRAAAAYALGFRRDVDSAEALGARLLDVHEDPEVRAYAAEALGHRLQGEEQILAPVRTAIQRGLRDPVPEIRFWSAFAAGVLELREARPLLERLARDDDAELDGWWTVGEEAEWALKLLAGELDAPLPREREPERI